MAKYTAIGGQALIEGIMMKSPEKTALAVRCPDNSIDITYMNGKSIRERVPILRLPILRGVAGFVESMIQGYKAMMISADKSGMTDLEDEKEKKQQCAYERYNGYSLGARRGACGNTVYAAAAACGIRPQGAF